MQMWPAVPLLGCPFAWVAQGRRPVLAEVLPSLAHRAAAAKKYEEPHMPAPLPTKGSPPMSMDAAFAQASAPPAPEMVTCPKCGETFDPAASSPPPRAGASALPKGPLP